jgi:hypothetical protein
MENSLITMPTESEVLAMYSVAEMKSALRISHNVEDDYMKSCIMAAYDWLAGPAAWLNRPILNTAYKLYLTSFADVAEIPSTPFISATSLKYYADGVLTTVPTSVYGTRISGPLSYGSLYLKTGQVWPSPYDTGFASIELEYLAGFGTGADVKAKHPALVRALSILANDYFRNREDTFVDIRMVEIDRRIVNNVEIVAGRYKIYNRIF